MRFRLFALFVGLAAALTVAPACLAETAPDPNERDTIRDLLERLEKTRAVRWCAVTEGIATLVVDGAESEKLLVESLPALAQSEKEQISAEISLKAASALAAFGFLDEALAFLDALAEEPTEGDALFLKSWCLDGTDRAAEASKGYEIYERGGGLLGDYALLRGARCLKKQGFTAAGAKVLERLVQRWRAGPLWDEGVIELCDYYLDLERYESCAAVAELAASEARSERYRYSGLHYLARAFEESGRRAEAVSVYWKIVQGNPSHPKAGDAFVSFREIKAGLGMELGDEELYRGGVALSKTGKHKEAYEVLKELAARGRGRRHWRDGVGEMARISYARRRYTEASEHFKVLADEGGPGADEALLWHGKCELRAGRYERGFEILERLGRDPGDVSIRAEALWEAAREKESQGLISEALPDYAYAAENLSKAELGPEACWRLGFCRYLTDDLEGAREAFVFAADVSRAAYLRAQSLYWLAKTLWRMERRAEAESALRKAAAEGPGVYYGARAAWILEKDMGELENQSFSLPGASAVAGSDPAAAGEGPDSGEGTAEATQGENSLIGPGGPAMRSPDRDSLRETPDGTAHPCGEVVDYPGLELLSRGSRFSVGGAEWHLARGVRLLSWGDRRRGSAEIRRAVKLGFGRSEAVAVLNFHGCYIEAMLLAGSPGPGLDSRPSDRNLYASFPLAFADHIWRHSAEAGLDPFLALSIARQESRFDPGAVSGAGACGLMQIMPGTGRKMSRELGIRWRGRHGLLDPRTNIRMGSRYFAEMLDALGNLPAALAAYNGGASKAREWAALAEGKGLDAYIEMIGYRETRKYVKLVIMWYLTYLRMYHPEWGGSPPSPASHPAGDPAEQGR